ncbi:MAG: MBL fold metallo-hydrolase [Sporomusaceae bacterium]|nr:MBL fold metallo-hydrolase [Sporomusaceae bacterium]
MKLIIHRGAHQIGGSCIELSTRSTRIILDAGQVLPSLHSEKSDQPPELPKVNGLYQGGKCKVDAVLFSHYHGDHTGLIESIHPDIPVYMGEATAKVMNMMAQFVSVRPSVQPAACFVSGQAFQIGDFTITPYLVDHSAYDAYAFVIQAEEKCVVYTGDLRMHGKKAKATVYFIKKLPQRVDALLLEGTMLSRISEPVETEDQIAQQAYEFMKQKKGPVLVMQSAVNIDRLVGMYRAAKRSNRLFVMDIFTANIVAELGEKIPNPLDFSNIKVFYPYFLTKRMFKDDGTVIWMKRFSRYRISREELGTRQDYSMLVRDSMLSDLQHINNIVGAGLIYSLWGGYMQTERVRRFMQYCRDQQVDVIHLHTSGHADVNTLRKIVQACTPKNIIPIHTEYPERFNDEFDNVRIVGDGKPFILENDD